MTHIDDDCILSEAIEYNGSLIRARVEKRETGFYPTLEKRSVDTPDGVWFTTLCLHPAGGFAILSDAISEAEREGKELVDGIMPDMFTDYDECR